MGPAELHEHDVLLRELGRINSELAAQRRHSAIVAHDLATPAQVILGLAEVLLEHPGLDPYVDARLQQLQRSAQTLSSLVGELGRGMSMETRTDGTERIDLAELAASVADRSRLLATSKDMTIELVHLHGGEPLPVEADPARVDRALSNLVGNAIKFSPSRSTVTLTVRCVDQHAVVEVADEGPGISVQGRERIFEVFHREQKTAHLPGLGLGLHIARQVAEGLGGRIEVESELGEGSRFSLVVPLATGGIDLTETA